jgi:hypothetical protein
MKLQYLYILSPLVMLACFSCIAQELKPSATPAPASSVQLINASSIPSITLDIIDFHKYENLPQGAKISGGHFPFTTWKLRAQQTDTSDEKAFIEKNIQKSPNTSSTAVIIGNFEWKFDEDGKKKNLQAAILNIDHELGLEDAPNSLTIINGLVDKILRVSINSDDFDELSPMSQKTYRRLPNILHPKAIIENEVIKIPIKFNNEIKGGIVAFYENDRKIKFVAMPQNPF